MVHHQRHVGTSTYGAGVLLGLAQSVVVMDAEPVLAQLGTPVQTLLPARMLLHPPLPTLAIALLAPTLESVTMASAIELRDRLGSVAMRAPLGLHARGLYQKRVT
jgi:hypothetical protein